MEKNKKENKMTRRRFIGSTLGAVAGLGATTSLITKGLADFCDITPPQTEGPFYPERDQQDKDNVLTHVRGGVREAEGQVIHIMGQITDQDCNPVRGALIEIWQACASGKYNHSQDPNTAPLDPNFQYWGKHATNEKGEYYFETIMPGDYPATASWIRPSHIHFKVMKRGYRELTSQLYFQGNRFNAQDRILQSLSREERERVTVRLENPEPDSDFDLESKVCYFDITLEEI